MKFSVTALFLMLCPALARAAEHIDAASLTPAWGVPFAGMLLSIACMPLLAPAFWHRHYGKIALGWGLALLLPFAVQFGAAAVVGAVAHALLAEYLPFVILLGALYVIAGGIAVRGRIDATPGINTGMLALGCLLASIMGTTGAAMLLIRPLLRANASRPRMAHVVVFFIFLVANIGGSLTPLGDPPLFLGFLNGVSFFWTTEHLLAPMVFASICLLALFYLIDTLAFRRARRAAPAIDTDTGAATDDNLDAAPEPAQISLGGAINFVLLAGVLALVLLSGFWKPGIQFDVAGTPVALQNLLRDGLLVVLALLSLWWTPRSARVANRFEWEPIVEVAKLFAGIFITIAPVIEILRAGEAGAFGAVVRLVSDAAGEPIDSMYFWATGILSSFLDNAPTYLVFFNSAGGDAQHLMTAGASTLAAISAGAVFMGANTYIGNAPNFMVKSIAEGRGVKMPGFFGYMLWSGTILLPLYALMTWLFFHIH